MEIFYALAALALTCAFIALVVAVVVLFIEYALPRLPRSGNRRRDHDRSNPD